MHEDNRKTQRLIATTSILFAVALIAVGEIAYTHRKMTPMTPVAVVSKPAATASTSPTSSTSKSTNANGFKDGTYNATGKYNSPGGQESITVTVTLKSGVISSSSAKSGANDLTAKEYQSDFITNYKSQVVGKNISDVQLSRVSGSSLTSQGFNSAIAKIKSEAQS